MRSTSLSCLSDMLHLGHFFHDEEFDIVAFFEVVKTVDIDTAFKAGTDFADVFFKPLERSQAAFWEDDCPITHHTHFGITACFALGDVAQSHRAQS